VLAFGYALGLRWIVHEQVFLVQSFAIVKIVIIAIALQNTVRKCRETKSRRRTLSNLTAIGCMYSEIWNVRWMVGATITTCHNTVQSAEAKGVLCHYTVQPS
jgi:chromate transport protein ChrA